MSASRPPGWPRAATGPVSGAPAVWAEAAASPWGGRSRGAAQEAAKRNGATQTTKAERRTGIVVRRDGRDPLGPGSAIGMMTTARGMVAPAVGGSVLAQVDDILAATAPELAGHLEAVKFDAERTAWTSSPKRPRTARSCAGKHRS
ncbi:hypothetical protein [Streptomyces griseofuscus]|uniref:hypothetical protein n=1 Tax=Streptomyces griseofuscus TaxID=146922 RepID=UPI0033FD19A7